MVFEHHLHPLALPNFLLVKIIKEKNKELVATTFTNNIHIEKENGASSKVCLAIQKTWKCQ